MPSFLTNTSSQCCCPEMRCCAPETVVAALDGWDGTGMCLWVNKLYLDLGPSIPPGTPDLDIGKHACAYEVGVTGCFKYLSLEWDATLQKYVIDGEAIYDDCVDVVWPSIVFPQYDPYGLTAQGCDTSGAIGGYVEGFSANQECADRCEQEIAARLCDKPDGGAETIVYGPAGGVSSFPGGRTYLADYNDSYVCHRVTGDLRPEFVATVNRSVEAAEEDIEARLVFDVFCRRNWEISEPCNGYIIPSLSCAVSDNPPETPPGGSWYCIDYRCGPRWPAADNINNYICEQFKCTAQEGTVWPHLIPFSLTENYSAVLKLILVPGAYWFPNANYDLVGPGNYQASKSEKAVWWRVGSVKVVSKGSGYSVGEFFEVDFDPFWIQQLTGREINVGFPEFDVECQFPLTWLDKYGGTATVDAFNVKRYFQRLRVTKVDENGGIEELEVVPWFKDPDFIPGQCITVLEGDARTKHYPGYMRVVCHPNSVDIGGTGYHVNDTITFTPTSPGVEPHAEAIAKVVDVDDDGAVLDWQINGSDVHPPYYGYGAGNQYCDQTGDDERGAYKWPDKRDLCYLHWEGVGVPVRQASPYSAGNELETFQNTGGLTSIQFTIQRVPCRTTISVVVDAYQYERAGFLANVDAEDADQKYKLLKKYPPYPKCVGGGAQITPVIGTDGANESAIGGPLAGGEVKSPGAYYAFKDKTHVVPILPKNVPDIVGENGTGTGAVINAFSFDQVTNFPQPNYADGELFEPAASRFAYFPVTGATIAEGGSGYEVDQEFDVWPVSGTQWTHPWKLSGGDNPDAVPNGSWYEGQNLTASGHVPAYTSLEGVVTWLDEFEFRQPQCRLRISDVDESGAITGLEVVHGGLMFRPSWTVGVRHPEVYVHVGSDTGHGADATVAIDDDKDSETFGQVTGCTIVQIPVETEADPLHSTPGNPVAYPLGGRDYANPDSGMMWEMQDIEAGAQFGVAAARMLSHVVWHGWVYDHYHPDNSTHDLIEGTLPPFKRRAEHCTLNECYHTLLNRTYDLYRPWGGQSVNGPYGAGGIGGVNSTSNRIFALRGCTNPLGPNSRSPLPYPAENHWVMDGRPKCDYGLFRKKGTRTDVYLAGPEGVECDSFNYEQWNFEIDKQAGYNGLPSANEGDYTVLEYGYTISLSATIPVYPNCPDHEDGRTSP